MAAFLTSPVNGGRDDYIHLLSSPAQQPWALFASPAPAVQDGRLSFDVLTSPGVAVEDAVFKARSHSHLELFTLERSVSISLAQQQDQQQELRAALTEKLVAKVVDAKQTEVEKMVAGVAAKYGLAADYGQAEDTIKAVWAEQSTRTSWAHAASEPRAGAVAKQHAATAVAAAEEATLGRDSSANASGDEEAGQQVTSMLKAAAAGQAARMVCGVKRTLDSQVSFSFQAPTQPGNEAAGTAGGVQKRRRVQYDRMRELESQVQRVRLQGDSLGQSLRQAQIQHAAASSENEQLWNALLHIHASLRAAHAAQLRQQVAMHTAAVAAALPLPEPAQAASMPAPTSLFGGLFSPDAADLAASCGMFVSPNKQALELAAHTANNKPRKLFLEESGKLADGMRPGLAAPGNLPAELASLWMQAA